MKILMNLRNFLPNVGGVENIGAQLARHFVREGHTVRLWTLTPAGPDTTDAERGEHLGYPVYRQPSVRERLPLFRWCDLYFQAHYRWRPAWPLLLIRRPWVVWNPDWNCANSTPARTRFSRLAPTPRFITNSHALAEAMPWPTHVIVNPYDDETFFLDPQIPRERDFLFVGRLVEEKGADLFIRALQRLHRQRRPFTATITGVGEQEPLLRAMVKEGHLSERVRFSGPLCGRALADDYRSHRVVVVPSRWREPFGIVALEALACGCTVVGSAGGGLPEAIGPGGLTFPNGDDAALAQQLIRLMDDLPEGAPRAQQVQAHLDRHRPAQVARQYLNEFQRHLSGAKFDQRPSPHPSTGRWSAPA